MRTESRGGKKYFVTFIDDHSRWCKVYLLTIKDEGFDAFKSYKAYAENKCGTKIKCLQSDNGGEYLSKQFDKFLDQNGVKSRLTTSRAPQQNEVAEHKNRDLLEKNYSLNDTHAYS